MYYLQVVFVKVKVIDSVLKHITELAGKFSFFILEGHLKSWVTINLPEFPFRAELLKLTRIFSKAIRRYKCFKKFSRMRVFRRQLKKNIYIERDKKVFSSTVRVRAVLFSNAWRK